MYQRDAEGMAKRGYQNMLAELTGDGVNLKTFVFLLSSLFPNHQLIPHANVHNTHQCRSVHPNKYANTA